MQIRKIWMHMYLESIWKWSHLNVRKSFVELNFGGKIVSLYTAVELIVLNRLLLSKNWVLEIKLVFVYYTK